ncbi:MAG: hypothetical protein ACLFWD_07075, partial [Anaerolineales bacterium]
MINRWFYGTLGKLAGVLYTLGIISLVLSVSLGSTLGVQASPATQGQGNCLAAGAGQERDKYDDGGDHTFNAPSGWIYVEAGLKAGDACFSRTTDGTITVEGEACYSVSGLGTNSVTIEQLKSTSVCKDISHTEAIREQAPTDPPEPTEETPSPEPTTETPEPEPTTETPEPEPTTETPEPEPTTETPEP